jgi:hypothetical protein
MIKEITPALFLSCLVEAMSKYTSMGPTSREGLIFLHLHFISQSALISRKNYKNLRKDLKLPNKHSLTQSLGSLRTERKKPNSKRNKYTKIKYQMLASVVQKSKSPNQTKIPLKDPDRTPCRGLFSVWQFQTLSKCLL